MPCQNHNDSVVLVVYERRQSTIDYERRQSRGQIGHCGFDRGRVGSWRVGQLLWLGVTWAQIETLWQADALTALTSSGHPLEELMASKPPTSRELEI
jgi:hypothetical protein